ncbi:MAG: sulfatase [Promethearchaeota archaeon]
MPEKPNIVYIFSDQHRGDTLGCVGHPAVITPNLDKLASEGVNFTRCCTNSPLCMPARASMMTGKYVNEHGVWTNFIEANPNGPSHVRNIRQAGYHTALIGKTHLWIHGERGERRQTSRHTRDKLPVLKDWGFEDIYELTGPIATIVNDSPYTDYLKEKGLLKTHRKYMIKYFTQWSRGHAKPWEEPPCPLPVGDHLDSFTGRKAVEWIHNYKDDKPFYLQVLFPGPHDPFDSPAEYRAMYKPENMPVGILEWPQKPIPSNVRMVLNWSGLKDMTPAQNQLLRTFYYAKITLIDEYIGKIMKTLEKKNLMENTWIIYNSDHGEMLGDHMMSHKIVFYEGALRIPCIFRPPGGIKGWKSQGLTDHLDIAASIIDIAHAKPLAGSDGQSFIQKINEGPYGSSAQEGKEGIFSEVHGFSMIRTDQYKMVVKSNTRRPVELYELIKDPKELNNLVRNKSYKSVLQELLERFLNKLLNRMNIK